MALFKEERDKKLSAKILQKNAIALQKTVHFLTLDWV